MCRVWIGIVGCARSVPPHPPRATRRRRPPCAARNSRPWNAPPPSGNSAHAAPQPPMDARRCLHRRDSCRHHARPRSGPTQVASTCHGQRHVRPAHRRRRNPRIVALPAQPLGAERHTIEHDTMTTSHPQPTRPSGRQIEITHADQSAWIVEVGGSLRAYQVGDHDVLDGYSADERCTAARGQSLIPWPNRLRDGRYRFADRDHQLPLTEPDKRNAIHGLTRWANWTPADHAVNRVTMRHRLHPQPGYPFALDLEITYSLADDGLHVHTTATNIGTTPAPYGTGAHPTSPPARQPSTPLDFAPPDGSGFPPTIAVSRPEQNPSPTRTMTSKRRAWSGQSSSTPGTPTSSARATASPVSSCSPTRAPQRSGSTRPTRT